MADNFGNFWTPRGVDEIVPGLDAADRRSACSSRSCVSQTGSLFSADAWNNITFTAGEVRDPRRNIPLSLALGTIIVIGLYLLANVAYLVDAAAGRDPARAGGSRGHGHARSRSSRRGRRASWRSRSSISTFGCNNGLILAGARAYYAMARDGLFFRSAGELNARESAGLGAGCCRASGRRFWCCRAPTIPSTGAYGNLYSNLLDYVVSAALIFYILTIAGVFRLRRTRPDAERPYRAFGYPVVPALYIAGASAILLVLFVYRTATTWPGLVIVLLGVPVYFAWKPGEVRT